MALDVAALKSKLNELQKKSNDSFFKPEEGDTVIRLVPLKSNPSNPFIQVYTHYGLGGKNYLSPLTYGERDPIAEFSDALIGEGGLSKEDYKAAKKFFPTLRTFVPIVVRGKEAEGVKYWAFGKTIYEQLLKIMTDEDYGDITDVKNGWDIKLTFTPQEKSDTNFAKTEIMVRPKQTPLHTDKEVVNKLLNEQTDLIASFKRHTVEELEAALKAHLKVVDDSDTPETATEEEETSTPAKAPKITSDVADEFNKIFES